MFSAMFPPPGTPCWEFPPNTKAHFVLEQKHFTKKKMNETFHYMNVYT